MDLFFRICASLSFSILLGLLLAGIKYKLGQKNYSSQQISIGKKYISKISTILKYITFSVLVIGFIWCVYFLTLGIFVPHKAGYADNMSELIVSVLTVISIIFAFVEFIRRGDDTAS